MKILIRNYVTSIFIFTLLLCVVHLPFSQRSSSVDISYPADDYFQKGLVLFSNDSLDNAVKAFTAAIEYQPRFAPYHYYLALTYERKYEYERAIEAYNSVIAIDPEFYPAFYHLGNLLAKEKEYDQGTAMLRRAVQLNPYYIKAFKTLAELYIANDDPASAEKIYNYLKYIGHEE